MVGWGGAYEDGKCWIRQSAVASESKVHKFRGVLNLGVPVGVPYSKDYSILGSMLGSPYLGKLPCDVVQGLGDTGDAHRRGICS